MKFTKLILSFVFLYGITVYSQDYNQTKKNIIQSIENHEEEIIKISDKIWELAETAFNEHESSKLLSDYAEANGFKLERGVAGMPTAFVATYGEGKPVISVLGEFDALPGLSQDTTPSKKPLYYLMKPFEGPYHLLIVSPEPWYNKKDFKEKW